MYASPLRGERGREGRTDAVKTTAERGGRVPPQQLVFDTFSSLPWSRKKEEEEIRC